jgi:hypothetical protein
MLEEGELAEFYRVRHQAADKVPRIEHEKRDRNPCLPGFLAVAQRRQVLGQRCHLPSGRTATVLQRAQVADAPEEFPFYLSQHRKLGDDIYVYTQQPQNVDKMFRSFTQEFIYVVNIGKKRVGPFAAPKIFRFAAYPEPFTGQVGQICQYSGYFRMDYELAATYNTAAGIGIEAAKADVGSKVKGLHWRWLLLLPVLLACVRFRVSLVWRGVGAGGVAWQQETGGRVRRAPGRDVGGAASMWIWRGGSAGVAWGFRRKWASRMPEAIMLLLKRTCGWWATLWREARCGWRCRMVVG